MQNLSKIEEYYVFIIGLVLMPEFYGMTKLFLSNFRTFTYVQNGRISSQMYIKLISNAIKIKKVELANYINKTLILQEVSTILIWVILLSMKLNYAKLSCRRGKTPMKKEDVQSIILK